MKLKTTYTFTLFIFCCEIAFSQILFENTYQDNGEVSGESITMTSDSGFVITGFTNPTGGFFGQEVLLMKIDKNGDHVFSTYFGGVGFDIGRSVIETYDKGFVLCGSFASSLTVSDNMYIIKTDSAGNFQWETIIGDTLSDWATDLIEIPSDSSLIVSGWLDEIPAIVKLDKNGDTLWAKRYDQYLGRINSITHTSNDEFLLAGLAQGQKGLIILTDSQGNEIWSKTIDGNGSEQYYGSAELQNGKFVVAGRTLENSEPPNANAILRYFSQNGELIDFQTFGLDKQDHFEGLIVDNNNLVAVGRTNLFKDNTNTIRGLIVKVDLDDELSYNDVLGSDTINSLSLNDVALTHDGYYMVCGLLSNSTGAHVYVAKLDVTGAVLDVNIYQENETFEVNLFPNPMQMKSTLSFSRPIETECDLIIFSSKGKMVKSDKISSGSLEYSLHRDNLSPGVYYINIISNSNKYLKKLIIN
ncbi:MAG: T9SS type A sorting domain-containing protein [Crocinitomicaceae bacterium]|nr:T9SS type A sorting domain-containing protein [Crocinitomicaceae bacterium]